MTVEEWLNGNNLGVDICKNKYMQTLNDKKETFDEMTDRVSNGNEEVKRLILEKKFLFGGRTMTNYNTGRNASTSNCYSSGFAPDSVDGIMELSKNLAITYKTQGGQGLSLSKIRPKGSMTSGGYESDGIVPFMRIFDRVTESISQGGSRKGALMMSLDAWHKEAEKFITIKSKDGEIEKANLSLEIDDEFMDMVKHYFKTGEKLTKHIVFKYDSGEIEYDVCPIDIYETMCQNALDWAEPGVIFTNEFRNRNIMEFVDDYMVITGNPCGEQPLPKNGACNLGSMNLSEYVKNPYTNESYFDMDNFLFDTQAAIYALDEVLDYGFEYHALQEQRDMARNYRNTGLGVMGVASMFLKMGITYGSDESLKLIDNILYHMFRSAVLKSSEIASDKGSFPKYTKDVWESRIIREHFNVDEIELLKKSGLRNCSLLSIAPSGSIGTMLNVSTGCEPIFRVSYQRQTKSLHKDKEVKYDVYIKEAEEYMALNKIKKLPDYFVSSDMIPWKNRIDMQATMQKHIDTAISSTLNMPKETTVEDVKQAYLYGWEQKLKGMTIYVDGCKRAGILTTNDSNPEVDNDTSQKIIYDSVKPISRKTIGTTHGSTFCKKCACGTLYITVNRDNDGHVVECFVHTSKGGICQANIGAINRMVSLALRSGVKLDEIADQLRGINCPACVKVKTKGEHIDGISCPDILARTLVEFSNERNDQTEKNKITSFKKIKESKPTKSNIEVGIDTGIEKCPDCREPIKHEGGCRSCLNCGWSACQ